MFWDSFKITFGGIAQIIILAGLGFFLIKRNILGPEGLTAISRLVLEVTLPLLVFVRIVRDFDFALYPQWWIFPLLSIAVTAVGLAVGALLLRFVAGREEKLQFLSLVSFQNSGYLPLALIAAMLPKDQVNTVFIYLFLFLMGFNLVFFSLGVYLLTMEKQKKFDWARLLNPPVIATLAGLALVLARAGRFIPAIVLAPLETVGDCTVPLSALVVGGNIAAMRLSRIDFRAMALMALAKLCILPALGLWAMRFVKVPELIGLLVVIQLAMPPATNLSVLTQFFRKEDRIISQGIFFGHILSLVTIPMFLSFYFMINVLK